MKTILIVDDEYAFVENLTELLGDEGYRVVSAANGKDGLVRVQAEKPDLVLADLMMPIADGRELVRSMRALREFRSTPIMLMSASPKAAALSDPLGGAMDVSAFLRKPFAWEKLLEVVVRLIGKGEKSGTLGTPK
jgi:CheY-like chemotaxis protein